MEKVSETRKTTVGGAIAAIGAIALTLIPPDVGFSCIEGLRNSENPVLVGGLLSVGILGMLLGPSLKK